MLKNKYQSWWDWVQGRWTCPKCKQQWQSMLVFHDCKCWTHERDGTSSSRLACPKCGDIDE